MIRFPEKELFRIWRHQLLTGDLVTETGQPVQVISPGRLNGDEGPDFSGAVIEINGQLSRGDIEIHLETGGWQEHGHHLDAVYNKVILHVVLRNSPGGTTLLQNGGEAPILALQKYLDLSSRSNTRFQPCHWSDKSGSDALPELLDKAGEDRFMLKAELFKKEISQKKGECLYRGLMGALGYSRNKLPFLELARRVPLSQLETLTPDDIPEAEWLAAREELLLERGGLMEGCSGDVSCIPREAWHLMKVRPGNSPYVRIKAMTRLLLRYRSTGLLQGLFELIGRGKPERDSYEKMEAGLIVDDVRSRFTESRQSPLLRKGQALRVRSGQALLGSSRASEIAVNVLLPFAFAWSESFYEPERSTRAIELYRGYHRLAVNSIEQYMSRKLGLSTCQVNSACRQQGLLHIYKNWCSRGECRSCMLNKSGHNGVFCLRKG